MPVKIRINNPISWLVGLGVIAFFLGLVLFGGKTPNGPNGGYGELVIEGKENAILRWYGKRANRLRDSLAELNKTGVANTDEIAIQRQQLENAIRKLVLDSVQCRHGNADTSLSLFTKTFWIHRDQLKAACTDPGWAGDPSFSRPLIFHVEDSAFQKRSELLVDTETLYVRWKSGQGILSYFSKNPVIGFWLILTVTQLAMWVLIFPLLGGSLQGLKQQAGMERKRLFSFGSWAISSLLPLLTFAIFIWLFYFFLIEGFYIQDQFFLKGFNQRMNFYSVLGYLAATACFGMYLLMASGLANMNRQPVKLAESQEVKGEFELLKKGFDQAFGVSALILSTFVLWMGVTFSGINETEFMRLYRFYSGKPFLSSDLIYLTGMIHTLLLLVFYIPVRLKFNNSALAAEASKLQETNGKKIWKTVLESAITILVTASPLITGILQQFLDAWFK